MSFLVLDLEIDDDDDDDDDDEASGLPSPLDLDSRISNSATDSIGKKFDEDPLYPFREIVNSLNKHNCITQFRMEHFSDVC